MRIFLLAASGLALAACSDTTEPSKPAPQTDTASEAGEISEATTETGSDTSPTETDIADNSTLDAGDWSETDPPNFYGEGWDISWGWGGEYPAGFSVIKEGVSVPYRANPDPNAPQAGTCAVDFRGVYQPWNQSRSDAIDAYYMTATQMVDYTLSEPQELTFFDLNNDDEVKRTFAAGDKITFKRYLGEGIGQVLLDGTAYETDLMAFYETATPSIESPETHDWLSMMCNDERVWLRHADAIAQDGIVTWTPHGWGEANDLSDEELAFELNLERDDG